MAKDKPKEGSIDGIDGITIEYFCPSCLQLRLSFRSVNTHCGNCGRKDIITGEPGTLDKQALIAEGQSKEF